MTEQELLKEIKRIFGVTVEKLGLNQYEFELTSQQYSVALGNLKKYPKILEIAYADAISTFSTFQVSKTGKETFRSFGNKVQFSGCDTLLFSFIKCLFLK